MPYKPSHRSKVDFHVWIPEDIAEMILQRAATRDQSATNIIETLIRNALTQEEAAKMQRSALPIMRQALGEDQAIALEAFRQQIRADVQEITQRHIDRLAALLVRSARSTSLTWRLIYRLVQRQYGAAVAQTWYDEERAKAGKAMATRTDSGKEIDQ